MGAAMAGVSATSALVTNKFFSDQQGHIEDQYKDAQKAQEEKFNGILKDQKDAEAKVKANRRRAVQAATARMPSGGVAVGLMPPPGNYTPKTLLGQ